MEAEGDLSSDVAAYDSRRSGRIGGPKMPDERAVTHLDELRGRFGLLTVINREGRMAPS